MLDRKSKKTQIIIRTTEEMKIDIFKLAEQSRRELSDYLRLLIEDAIKSKKKL